MKGLCRCRVRGLGTGPWQVIKGSRGHRERVPQCAWCIRLEREAGVSRHYVVCRLFPVCPPHCQPTCPPPSADLFHTLPHSLGLPGPRRRERLGYSSHCRLVAPQAVTASQSQLLPGTPSHGSSSPWPCVAMCGFLSVSLCGREGEAVATARLQGPLHSCSVHVTPPSTLFRKPPLRVLSASFWKPARCVRVGFTYIWWGK